VDANIDYIKAKSVSIYSDINQVPQKQFDLVTAIHVLEHVSKPLDYLKKMTNLVKKGGYLVIEVPTWKSPGGSLRFAHLYHFEPDVLKLMCAQVGLTVEHTEFTPHLLLICKHDK
jgi:2-polyprenyl-3-methyl-5-hydroxy-6-metoxy-1,4-benzoquinol methylase